CMTETVRRAVIGVTRTVTGVRGSGGASCSYSSEMLTRPIGTSDQTGYHSLPLKAVGRLAAPKRPGGLYSRFDQCAVLPEIIRRLRPSIRACTLMTLVGGGGGTDGVV